jgi:hypothetical protein
MFDVHIGSTLSLTGLTLQHGNPEVRPAGKGARGGTCSGAEIQRIAYLLQLSLCEWWRSFRIIKLPYFLSPSSPSVGW